MIVSHVRCPDGFLFLVEFDDAQRIDPIVRRSGFTPAAWQAVPQHYVEQALLEHAPDLHDLCRYAYGRGFLRGLGDEQWQHGPVSVLRQPSSDEPFAPETLSLISRLVEVTGECALNYLFAELRVMGENHAQNYVLAMV